MRNKKNKENFCVDVCVTSLTRLHKVDNANGSEIKVKNELRMLGIFIWVKLGWVTKFKL